MKLETERLILRKPRMSDWKILVEELNDLDISRYTKRIPYPYKEKDAKGWIKNAIKKGNQRKAYPFIIELKSEKKVIGVIEIMSIKEFSKTGETGSWIAKKYQRKGYISEAKIAANEFAFNKLRLRKLSSFIYPPNKSSIATQKRMGYKLEGRERKQVKVLSTGKVYDVLIYGLLKEDWEKNLSKLKKHLKEKIKRLEDD
jgi:ribosomal-protein-alanine N-acetyltransferase